VFCGAAGYTAFAMRPEIVPLRKPLAGLEQQIGPWSGRSAEPLTNEVLSVLGVDEYVSRTYFAPGEGPVSLYVGYYQSQREGDTIHSPMNCLPGAGWQPTQVGRTALTVATRDRPLEVNRILIEKGLGRQVVLYWYQSHGRVVASEYASKFYMVYDALQTNRSDAALVRIVSPVLNSDSDERAAERRAIAFAETLFPKLEQYLPS
jgi:EpsI family protein